MEVKTLGTAALNWTAILEVISGELADREKAVVDGEELVGMVERRT